MSDQTNQQQPKRKKPLGKAIRHTDAELDELSQIMPADIEAANALWKGATKPGLKNLLDAKPEDEPPNAD